MTSFRSIRFFAAFALLIVFASFGQAQTTLTSTTLSTAITAKDKVFTVASATNVNGPDLAESSGGIGKSSVSNLTVLLVDREVMDVVSISSTTVTVRRGTRGTAAAPHAASAIVTVGGASAFVDVDPYGSCTRTLISYVPIINVKTGIAWDCMGGVYGNFSTAPKVGTTVASVAGTTVIIAAVTPVSGTNAITAFTLPPALKAGQSFTLIPTAAFTGTATNNIAKAFTAVAAKALTFYYDGTLVYPSY